MTQRKARIVAVALERKGMLHTESHHHLYTKSVEGVVQLMTRISRSEDELDDHLLGAMASQCALRKKEFVDLVDCPLTEAAWDDLIRSRSSAA